MYVTWEDSGKGPIDLSLGDCQHLAIEAGFVFASADESFPLNKRANLQKLFDRFNVNSLTAFKQKFYTYQLNPHQSKDTSSVWASHELPNKNTTTATTDKYIGQLLHGKPHGLGILLTHGSTYSFVYIGSFDNGKQNGYGIILTPRGESFHGMFKDGETYGPGSYTFPRPQEQKQNDCSSLSHPEDGKELRNNKSAATVANEKKEVKRHRVRYDGMHLGRPFGKGVYVWSDGDDQKWVSCGEFDGMELKKSVSLDELHGVLLAASQNAEMAKRVASEVEDELKRHGLWEGYGEMLVAKGKGQTL